MLPYPISANRYWRNWRGQMRRSNEAREYRAIAEELARAANLPLLAGCVRFAFVLHPALPKDWAKREKKEPHRWPLGCRRIDIDNALKVVLDALQEIAYENDNQVTDLSIRLGRPIEGGGVAVTVGEDNYWEHPI